MPVIVGVVGGVAAAGAAGAPPPAAPGSTGTVLAPFPEQALASANNATRDPFRFVIVPPHSELG
jgi:hypothetical protein